MSTRRLNIVFMGNPDFAVPSLERLRDSVHDVRAVVTGSDKRRGRGSRRTPSPVKQTARQAGLAVIEVDDVHTDTFAEKIQEIKPDLFVIVAFKILPAGLLAVPSIGSVNLHASLLPKYRGAAPIHWAIVNGEEETGCTVFFLNNGIDTGSIINQEKTPVGILETTGDVQDRLKYSGADLLLKSINEIADGTCTKTRQDESLATLAPKIKPDDARIDFGKDYLSVHNLIRGMSPFPGAWTTHQGNKFKIYRTEPASNIKLEPGKAMLTDGTGYVGCDGGSLALAQVQPEGKKTMTGAEFLNGYGGRSQFTF